MSGYHFFLSSRLKHFTVTRFANIRANQEQSKKSTHTHTHAAMQTEVIDPITTMDAFNAVIVDYVIVFYALSFINAVRLYLFLDHKQKKQYAYD